MHPERILAIKLADLGDLLVTEPALRSLRSAFPQARIDVLTTPAASPLVEMLDPELHVISFDKHAFDAAASLSRRSTPARLAKFGARLRQSRYDIVVIFHHLTTPAGAMKFRGLAIAAGSPIVAGLDNGRGAFLTHRAIDLGFGVRHEAEYMLDIVSRLGAPAVDPAPRIRFGPPEPCRSGQNVNDKFALLFPTTGPFAPGRNWPAKSFAELSLLLAHEGIRPIIAGAVDAEVAASTILAANPDALDLTGQTTLPELVNLIRGARVVVSGDSFPGHLAAALDVPLVSLFGPSNHRAWGPYGSVDAKSAAAGRVRIVRHDVPCSPCLYTGYRLGRRNGCATRTCLTKLLPAEVMQAVSNAIEDQR